MAEKNLAPAPPKPAPPPNVGPVAHAFKPADDKPAINPDVPLHVHEKLKLDLKKKDEELAKVAGLYQKAQRIIERMKMQIGNHAAASAEHEETVSELQGSLSALAGALSSANLRVKELESKYEPKADDGKNENEGQADG